MEEGSFISILLSFCATTSTHPPILGRSVLCAGKVATKPNRSTTKCIRQQSSCRKQLLVLGNSELGNIK